MPVNPIDQYTALLAAEFVQIMKKELSVALINALGEQAYRTRRQAFEYITRETKAARITLATQIKRNAASSANYAVNISMKEIMASTAGQAEKGVAVAVKDISRTYNLAIRQRWRQVLKVNQRVASQAILDMLDKYDEVHQKRGAGRIEYRTAERYTGGKLRAALASPLMAQATLDGITFMNTDLLDTAARQWSRLNFGAGSRASSGEKAPAAGQGGIVDVSRFGIQTAFLQSELTGTLPALNVQMPFGPRPAYFIPKGLWSTSGSQGSAISNQIRPGKPGGNAFFLLSSFPKSAAAGIDRSMIQKRMFTKGVKAWGFLEAGVGSIARNMPAANAAWLSEIFEGAHTQANSLPVKAGLSPARIGEATAMLNRTTAAFRAAGVLK